MRKMMRNAMLKKCSRQAKQRMKRARKLGSLASLVVVSISSMLIFSKIQRRWCMIKSNMCWFHAFTAGIILNFSAGMTIIFQDLDHFAILMRTIEEFLKRCKSIERKGNLAMLSLAIYWSQKLLPMKNILRLVNF